VLPAGPFGVLLEFETLEVVQRCFAWVERWRASRPGVLVDVVPAERTLMAIAAFDDAGQRGLRDFVAAIGGVDWAAASDPAVGDPASASDAAPVSLPVRYDGPDLDEVARLTRLSTSEIVSLHTETEFTVAFTGFAPGFAYLTGLPDVLRVPRREAPRTRVPAGSVALGGPYAGVYPRESPGGWQLLGRLAGSAPALWDEMRESPALLRPGMRVRFHDSSALSGDPAGASATDSASGQNSAAPDTEAGGSGLRVLRAGPLTTVQDLGRPGFAHLGVPRSGAVDRAALKLANRLVGNPEDAAGLELTLGGGTVQLEVGRWVAVAGARCEVTVTVLAPSPGDAGAAGQDREPEYGSGHAAAPGQDGEPEYGSGHVAAPASGNAAASGAGREPGYGLAPASGHADASASVAGHGDAAVGGPEGSSLLSPAPSHQPMIMRTVPGTAFYAPEGAVVDVGTAVAGVRAYLAVAGGLSGVAVLGSRAVDLLSGVGGRALDVGDRLVVGEPAGLPPDIPGLGMAPLRDVEDPVVVRLVLGPRSEWFTDEAVQSLVTAQWTVGVEANRTAVRLDGPTLEWAREAEPASEPLVIGAVQVPRDGRPVLFLADHPVTGGYPVIACAHPADLDAVGQARPGTGIRFRMVGGGSGRSGRSA
jgi:KipI family sensor histidine kinase inhibitor